MTSMMMMMMIVIMYVIILWSIHVYICLCFCDGRTDWWKMFELIEIFCWKSSYHCDAYKYISYYSNSWWAIKVWKSVLSRALSSFLFVCALERNAHHFEWCHRKSVDSSWNQMKLICEMIRVQQQICNNPQSQIVRSRNK